MERIKNLNLYQKSILILMLVMALLFAVLYPMTISKVGYEYKNSVLVPHQENGNTVYSGKLKGEQATFTVTEDKTVIFQRGDKTYGPYTAKEDPTAVPKDSQMANSMTGVELRSGDEIIFRGGVYDMGDFYWLESEDGTTDNMVVITYGDSNGVERDANGNVVDPFEPTVSDILELMHGPELTHKGVGFAWFGAAFICLINAISMLFADELFRWHLSFRVWNADHLEPSDWELAGRYISWTLLCVMALVLFIVGLQ